MNVETFIKDAVFKGTDARSGSFFCYSPDKHFIIKTVYVPEAIFLKSIVYSLFTVCFSLVVICYL